MNGVGVSPHLEVMSQCTTLAPKSVQNMLLPWLLWENRFNGQDLQGIDLGVAV